MQTLNPGLKFSFDDMSSRLSGEFLRYFIASGMAFAVDFSTLYLLTNYAGIHYLASAAAGFILGLATVYLLSIRWVFSARRIKDSRHELIVFSVIGMGGLGINELGLYLMTEFLLLHYMTSKILVSFLVFSWNFGVRKLVLFR
ncbi:MAG: GtrA family protein [Gammaproteobacteria bacterium]|nr:GtrA family protein [Gammaproteobacteria bacterium]